MKKFLALLTAIFISFVSTSTVIACGKIEEKDNSGALKEALLEKFHQVVNVGYENYMQSKRENFLLAVSSTTSTGYRFINKEVMNTYYNKNTKNFNDSKEIELGKIIDDPIHLEYLNYDVTQRILDLDSMRMAIIDEIQKNTDAKLLGQFIDDYGFNFLNTTNLDKVYKDSGGTPDGKPVQLNSEYLRALEKDVINRIINRQELQDYVKQQIIKDPFDAKKLMQFVPVGNIIENL
ncbi:hypothetical protein FQR65_LT19251 [Abscondita terminalis]|nr:hypothetical protein FQR65_LT19251 [Abscondita terminalis]